jgi:hypothetical protein
MTGIGNKIKDNNSRVYSDWNDWKDLQDFDTKRFGEYTLRDIEDYGTK